MQSNLRSAVVGATQLVVGLSTILRFSPPANMMDGVLAIHAGGGTLEIINGPTTGWGAGYHVGASERVQLYGPAVFYLAATGATMTAELLIFKTYNDSIL